MKKAGVMHLSYRQFKKKVKGKARREMLSRIALSNWKINEEYRNIKELILR